MIQYRRDIDGLRAVAVLPVIFFHLGSSLFSGGYVGVDVFFVISGFLITSTLRDEIEAGNFSIIRFYERRARRILPALFAMMLVTVVAGYFIFMPDELRDLGASLAATSLFVSNILFWQQTDYFAAAVDLKPLVHTWSLAVEEQYYILFPLFLAAIGKWGGRRFVWPTLVITLLSLAISIVSVQQASPSAYYLLPSRAWELLAGSLIALRAVPAVKSAALREAVAAGGLLAIVLSALLLTSESPFPGLLAIPPVLGSAAVIHAGSSGTTWAGRLLSLPVMVGVGLISYSLYLWHWPLIVFARYVAVGDLETPHIIAIFAATFVSAWLSWRFVERPFRNRTAIPRNPLFVASALSIVIGVAAGVGLFAAKGIPSRFPEVAILGKRMAAQRVEDTDTKCIVNKDGENWAGPPHCMLTKGPGTGVLLWGDSHALHYARALRDLSGKVKGSVLLYGMTACPPIFDMDIAKRPLCRAHNDKLFEVIRKHHVQRVLMSSFWQERPGVHTDGPGTIADTVRRLRAAGVEVAIIGDTPFYHFSQPNFLAARAARLPDPLAPIYMPVKNDRSVNPRLAQIVGPRMFFDPLAKLCAKDMCMAFDKGEPLMVDGNHLSRMGAHRLLVQMGPLLD